MADETAKASNWSLAQALYLKGTPNNVIAAQCNVTVNAIRLRASRCHWNSQRVEFQRQMTAAGQDPSGNTLPSLEESSEVVRRRLAAVLVLCTGALEKLKEPRTKAEIRELCELVKAVSDPGKTVFPQWEQPAQTTVINLNVLRGPRVVSPGEMPAQLVAPEANRPNLTPTVIDCQSAQ
jgi:hypothetical protein